MSQPFWSTSAHVGPNSDRSYPVFGAPALDREGLQHIGCIDGDRAAVGSNRRQAWCEERQQRGKDDGGRPARA
ncbi:hypothetical protein [Arthrobacter sp. 162MFSha1.1]|uniref:hypothetical protein n=1 Tax=Arthrobacter sp. 162MFSha1.1 TaxID=1151119 RepID=UPI000371FDF1